MSEPTVVIHKRIWLQVDEPEVSWCQDQIHDDDVEYVAVSDVEAAIERLPIGRAWRAALRKELGL